MVYDGPHRGHGRRTRRATRSETQRAHAGRGDRRRRHLPRPVGRRRAEAGDGQGDGATSRSSWRWPTRRRRSCRRTRRRCGPTRSSAPAARTIRTRSTTSLCFPFIFRGALDCGATTINEEMKLAAVRAIAALAQAEISGDRRQAYGEPTPALRARLPDPEAVRSAPDRDDRARGGARPAMDSGVATRPIADIEAYRQRLDAVRLPVGHDDAAGVRRRQGRRRKRVVYAEGEDERVLRAAQVVRRRGHGASRCCSAAPTSCADAHRAVRPAARARARLRRASTSRTTRATASCWTDYYQLAERNGVSRGAGAGGDAQPRHADRRDAGAPRRGRRDAVRHRRATSPTTCATCAT